MLSLSFLFEDSIHEILKDNKNNIEQTTAYELVKTAKKHGIIPKNDSRKIELNDGEYKIPTKDKENKSSLNPFSGRMKKKKLTKYLITKIKPEDRTFKNKPDNVRFQDWLLISGNPGKSLADGKWYGYSHRAIYGFSIGDKIDSRVCGFSDLKSPFIIKTDNEAKDCAKKISR